MNRFLALAYGLLCYAIFFATFLYSIGFIGNFWVPRTIDGAPQVSLAAAIAINLGLLTVFALQHSIMARPAFKRWWTRFVPKPVERSTYVLFSSLALGLLFWFWQPMGGMVWELHATWAKATGYTLFALGWVTVLVSTFLIQHFDLFGLRQVYLYARGRQYTDLPFVTPGPYRLVRHPLYVGWILVAWSTPAMSMAHLLFAVTVTAYILVAIRFEERDLSNAFPDYAQYAERVPMIVPRLRNAEMPTPVTTAAPRA